MEWSDAGSYSCPHPRIPPLRLRFRLPISTDSHTLTHAHLASRPTPARAVAPCAAKILETIKKGITESRDRTDLADGERKMLEHMKLYVMETKVRRGCIESNVGEIPTTHRPPPCNHHAPHGSIPPHTAHVTPHIPTPHTSHLPCVGGGPRWRRRSSHLTSGSSGRT